MATNRIVKSVNLAAIVKAGQQLAIDVAIETQQGTRSESMIDKPSTQKLERTARRSYPQALQELLCGE
jgi:hypothetical protein